MQNKSPSPFEKGTQGLKVDKPQEKLPTRIDQNDCPVPQDSEKLPLKAMASPTPKKVQSKASMDFYKAVAEIAVNGKRDKFFYTNHGVDSQKVVITGAPRYDKFFHIRKQQKKYNHLLLILDWVAFSSSSQTSMDIFKQVMCILRLLEQLKKVKLIIKLHPTQTESELMYVRSLVFKNNYYKKYVEVVKDSDITELLKKASIVFTHTSSVGLEALLMKKPVIILDILSGFKPVYKGYSGFLIAGDFNQLLVLTKKVLKDIDEYLKSNSKNIKKTIKYFYDDSKGESYKRVANLARDCINTYTYNRRAL